MGHAVVPVPLDHALRVDVVPEERRPRYRGPLLAESGYLRSQPVRQSLTGRTSPLYSGPREERGAIYNATGLSGSGWDSCQNHSIPTVNGWESTKTNSLRIVIAYWGCGFSRT